jgi:hypothetical protein
MEYVAAIIPVAANSMNPQQTWRQPMANEAAIFDPHDDGSPDDA